MSTNLIGTKEFKRIAKAYGFTPSRHFTHKWMVDAGAKKVGRFWKLYEFQARTFIARNAGYRDRFYKQFINSLGAQAADSMGLRPSSVQFTRFEPLKVVNEA